MVSFLNAGRLGNFLYETAAAFSYAKKHDLEFSVPDRTNDQYWNPITFPHLIHPNFHPYNPSDIMINELWNREQHFYEIEFDESWRDKNIFLNGYWQSFRQFDWCRDELLEAFGYPYEINKGFCSIHVRRGDYVHLPRLHPVCTGEYYAAAINMMFKKNNDIKFKIFSDDIPYCKHIFSEIPEVIEYSEGKTPEQDLISMTNCEHQICSNSTLALWGAELNQNKNKVVIVPSEANWFGMDNAAKMTVKDLFRPEWIQIQYKPIYEL